MGAPKASSRSRASRSAGLAGCVLVLFSAAAAPQFTAVGPERQAEQEALFERNRAILLDRFAQVPPGRPLSPQDFLRAILSSHTASVGELTVFKKPLGLPDLPGGREEALLGLAEAQIAEGRYGDAERTLGALGAELDDRQRLRVEILSLKLQLSQEGRLPPRGSEEARGKTLREWVAERDFNRVLYHLRSGRNDLAAAELIVLVQSGSRQLDPVVEQALLWLAGMRIREGNLVEAEGLLKVVRPNSPLQVEAMLLKARILVQRRDAGELLLLLERLAEMPGSDAAAEEVSAQLIRLLEDEGWVAQSYFYAVREGQELERKISALDDIIRRIQAPRELDALLEGRMKVADGLAARLVEIPNDARLLRLLKARSRLANLDSALVSWERFARSYDQLLQQDPEVLAKQVRDLVKRPRRAPARGEGLTPEDKLREILEAEMRAVFGDAPSRELRNRLLNGLSQWHLGKKQTVGSASATIDAGRLGHVIRDVRDLRKRKEEQTTRLGSKPYEGMRAWSAELGRESQEMRKRLQAMQPRIQQGLRARAVELLWAERGRLENWAYHAAHTAARLRERFYQHESQPWWAVVRERQTKAPGGETLRVMKVSRTVNYPSFDGVERLLRNLMKSAHDEGMRISAQELLANYSVQMIERENRTNHEEVIGWYRELLAKYPERVAADEVLYQLARLHDLRGDQARYLGVLDRLAKEYPHFKHGAEVEFRRAELLFSTGEYDRARTAYISALDIGGESAFAQQSRFKLGWSSFKLGEYREALPRFARIIDTVDRRGPRGQLSEADRDMLQETFRAMSLIFSYLKGAASINEFFASYGARPYAADIYGNLAEYYLVQKRYVDAADTYRYFLDRNPNHPEAPAMSVKVVDAYRAGNFFSLVVPAEEAFVKRYGPDSPYWKAAQAEQRVAVRPAVLRFTRELARRAHADAQKSRRPEDFRKAVGWYQAYLGAEPERKDVPPAHLLMAEALFDAGDYGRAGTEFERVGYEYAAHKDAPAAAYQALVAYQRIEAAAKDDKARRGVVDQLVASSRRFVAAYPNDKNTDTVLAKLAEEELWLANHERAVETARQVLTRTGSPELLARAWLVSAHALFELERFPEAEQAYVQSVNRQRGKPGSEELRKRLAISVYRQGEIHAQADQLELAVEDFLRLRSVVPGSEVIASAEFDAATLLLRERDWKRAVPILERFRREFPTHKLQAEIPAKLAVAYESAGRLGDAAGVLEEISRSSAEAEVGRQAMWRAAELRGRAGDRSAAVATLTRYLQRYPRPLEDAVEVRHQLAEFASKDGNRRERQRWLQDLVKAHDAGGSQGTARTRYLAATASLELAESDLAAFESVRLRLPLKNSLRRKKAALELVLKAYDKSAEYGVAEVTTAATYQIAAVYRRMGRDIMDSERPTNLNELEREQYGVLLEEEALPFEDKAIQLHETNLGRIREGVYDDWVQRSLAELKRLMPARYEKSERIEGYVPRLH